ncbi:MAG TPA: hypothetical protein VLK58_07440 [Conexibacter sp.]|nr:hypothetical protein [Conexibacter sp.]
MTTGTWSSRAARRWQREHAIPFAAAARFVNHDAAAWRRSQDYHRLNHWNRDALRALRAMRPSPLWTEGPAQVALDGLLTTLLWDFIVDTARLADLLPVMDAVVDDMHLLRIPAPLVSAARTAWRTCHGALNALIDHLPPLVTEVDRAIRLLVRGREVAADDLDALAAAVVASLSAAVPAAETMGDRLSAILHDAAPERDLDEILLISWREISQALDTMWHCSERLEVLSGDAVGEDRPYRGPRFMRTIVWEADNR